MDELSAFVDIGLVSDEAKMGVCVMNTGESMRIVQIFTLIGSAHELAQSLDKVHKTTGCIEFVLDAPREVNICLNPLIRKISPNIKILYISSTR
jgi:hypothetical protein